MDLDELLQELAGTKCRCGTTKPAKNTFCAMCYWTLTAKLRKALYNRVGEGYEGAYDAAVIFLIDQGRMPGNES